MRVEKVFKQKKTVVSDTVDFMPKGSNIEYGLR